MASYGYGGHILMLPEEDEEERECYDEGYPFSVPKVILDGFVEQYMPPKDVYSRSVDSVVTVRKGVVTQFKKTEFSEQLVEDENGNTVWFDSRKVPFNGEWQCKSLGEWREAEEYTVEEIDLEKNVKKTYKVTLQETVPLDERDIAIAQNYINTRKKNRVGDFVLDEGILVDYKGEAADVVLPDGITSIGDNAFYGSRSIESVTIPSGVTSIGCGAFHGCGALKSITIPSGVTSIERHTFSDCTALTSVIIPDEVEKIDACAFSGCTALKSIALPDTVKYIGGFAFGDCKALIDITLPKGLELIECKAFHNCPNLKSITIPASVTNIGSSLFSGTTDIEEIIIDGNKSKYFVEGNCIIDKTTCTLIAGSNHGRIPDGVMIIGEYAFSDCIGIESITIPDSVMHMGNNAFRDCTALERIIIPERIRCIDDRVFFNCTALTSVTIPRSVTQLGYCAFCGCSSLKDIYYKGTKAQWEAIEKADRWDDKAGKYVVHCAKGDFENNSDADDNWNDGKNVCVASELPVSTDDDDDLPF